jgi:hypothetical protein
MKKKKTYLRRLLGLFLRSSLYGAVSAASRRPPHRAPLPIWSCGCCCTSPSPSLSSSCGGLLIEFLVVGVRPLIPLLLSSVPSLTVSVSSCDIIFVVVARLLFVVAPSPSSPCQLLVPPHEQVLVAVAWVWVCRLGAVSW